jgi:hypothetical protein
MKPKITGSIRINGRRFRAGDEAELQSVLTRTQHDELQKRGLIAGDWDVSGEDGSTPLTGEPSPLENQLLEVLARYVGETGESEGAVDVLNRLIRERDEARAELATLKAGGSTPTEPLLALESLGSDVIDSLTAAGYDTPDAVAAASDKDLEAWPGIGEATIKKIRALLK